MAFGRLCRFCCGGSEDETDGSAPYRRLSNESVDAVNATSAVAATVGQPSDVARFVAQAAAETAQQGRSVNDNARLNNRTREQIEAEALNSIVEETQQEMIDVAMWDEGGLSTTDYLMRVKTYEQAVHLHDSKLRQQQAKTGAASSFAAQSPESRRSLIAECTSSQEAIQWLSRPPPSETWLEAVRKASGQVERALREDVVIEQRADLVALMGAGGVSHVGKSNAVGRLGPAVGLR